MCLSSRGGSGTFVLWDATTGRVLGSAQEHTSWVWSVAYTPDARTLVSGNSDGVIKLWDVASLARHE